MHVWTVSKPNFSHLKPFGCIAYIYINQGKLNPRVAKGIFIGYPLSVKGYKIWLIDEKKYVVSRTVIFHELATGKTNMQDNQPLPKIDTFQFEVETTSDHHSQDDLDKTND